MSFLSIYIRWHVIFINIYQMTCHFLLGKYDDMLFNQSFFHIKRLDYLYDVSACKKQLTDW